MTNRADILEALAERVEKNGPDRKSDELIAPVAGWVSFFVQKDIWWQPPVGANRSVRGDAPPFTASLDEAMTLVPEGCGWRLWMPSSENTDLPRVTMWGHGRTYAPHDTKAATPAAALTAACLRAHASILEKNNG